jgi:CRISPR system Cascade subunit CasD
VIAMQFLLFTLYAPFSAHGEVAVGEHRMMWDRPGRSAILGLVAAALGIDRSDEDKHARLDAGLWYAVQTDAGGQPFTDYQTTQVPSKRRKQSFSTRRQELGADDLNTILSVREWRSDALYTIALWPRHDDVELEAILSALVKPVFTLYLGRKAGPLGWPLQPRIVPADDLLQALENDPMKMDVELNTWLGSLKAAGGQSLAFDAEAQGYGAPKPQRIVVRRDQLASRARWQFVERREGILDHPGITS